MKHHNGTSRYAVCLCNEDYEASLERGKIYRVVPDAGAAKHGLKRVVDESGEDYLYPEGWFYPIKVPRPVQHVLANTPAVAATR